MAFKAVNHHFNTTTSCTYIRMFKVVNKLISDWCNEYIYENQLKTMYGGTFNNPKNPREKRVTVTNNNSKIYGACWHKTTFHQFYLNTDDLVFNG